MSLVKIIDQELSSLRTLRGPLPKPFCWLVGIFHHRGTSPQKMVAPRSTKHPWWFWCSGHGPSSWYLGASFTCHGWRKWNGFMTEFLGSKALKDLWGRHGRNCGLVERRRIIKCMPPTDLCHVFLCFWIHLIGCAGREFEPLNLLGSQKWRDNSNPKACPVWVWRAQQTSSFISALLSSSSMLLCFPNIGTVKTNGFHMAGMACMHDNIKPRNHGTHKVLIRMF